MKKKLLIFLLSACTAVGCTFGLSACSQKDGSQTKWGNEYSYTTAYAQAQELGYAGTLDEFIAMISGKDGKDGKDGTNGIDGLTPFIGENGNWFIGETDTGVKAAGTNGADGIDGNDGINGNDGKDGVDGLTPYIGENGSWFIGETDTGVKAAGTNGTDGADGKDGKDGADGINGINGNDGVGVKQALIDENGHLIIILTDDNEIDCGEVCNVHAHEYGEWITISEASCKNIGFEIRACEICKIAETIIIPKTEDHVWSKWRADEENDNHSRECSVCQKTESAEHHVVDNLCTDCGKYIGEPVTIWLIPPVQGAIVTDFDFTRDPTLGHWHFHTGIDIAADEGTLVIAAIAGTVESIIREDKLDGESITIVHSSGVKTIYHFIDVNTNLKVGDTVRQGEAIGTISAADGNEYIIGAHLHFEVHVNGEAVDPTKYIDFSID